MSSLDQYLRYIDDHDFMNEFPFQTVIAIDITNGLKFLHPKNIVHRDLKPGNILVSNRHYSGLRGSEMEQKFKEKPITCKLTDLGESRSEAIQTATLRHQGTIVATTTLTLKTMERIAVHSYLYCWQMF